MSAERDFVQSSTRGQSESVGALLLVAVVALAAATYGAIYLNQIGDGADAPMADMSAEATTTELELVHEAGDSFEESALRVRVRVDGTEWTNVTWESGTVDGTEAVDDDLFEPGETWVWDDGNFTEGSTLRVYLSEQETGTVLYRGTLTARNETVAGADAGDDEPDTVAPTLENVVAYGADGPSDTLIADGETITVEAEATDTDSGVASVTADATAFGGGTVTLTDDDGDGVYTGTTNADGDAADGDGTYDIPVDATDEAGNVATESSNDLELETSRPTVESVSVEPTPVSDYNVSEERTVTVTFSETMDDDTDPSVRILGLTGSPYVVSGGYLASDPTTWEGTVTLDDDDEERTATVDISGGSDLAGNPTVPDNDTTFEVDTDTTPSLTGVRVDDNTKDSTGRFVVSYDVRNPENFNYIEVTFDNQAGNDWADDVKTSTDPRGTVSYEEGGVEGDEYQIVLRVYNDSGDVVDIMAIDEVADGSNPSTNDDLSEPDGPEFSGIIVDDLSAYQADYELMYNVTNRSKFREVRIEVVNEDNDWASETYTSPDPRNGIDDYRTSDKGGTFGDAHRFVFQVIDDDGIVVDEIVVTDDAEGTDPSGNDDLTLPGSPTFTDVSVTDRSNQGKGVRYSVDYSTTGGSQFGSAAAQFANLDSRQDSGYVESTAVDGTINFDGPGYENDFVITVRLLDDDGILVDERVIEDTADNRDP